MVTEYMLELVYLRCDDCGGHLVEVTDLVEDRNMVYRFKEFLKCEKCGKTFDGYTYEIDDDNNIINFKLLGGM